MFARIGGFCHRHRRGVVLAWLVAVVAGYLVGYRVFDRFGVDYTRSPLESFQGLGKLSDASEFGVSVTALLAGVDTGDPGLATELARVGTDVAAVDGVGRVVDPLTVDDDAVAATLTSPDGRALLVTVDLDKSLGTGLPTARRDEVIDEVSDRLRALGPATGGTVLLGGEPLLQRELNEQTRRDTETGEAIALPLTLIVMTLIFGGVVAAGIPLLGAVASVAGGLSALYGFSYLLDLDPSVASVTTVLGLGLSIDYALLVITRYREERAAGRDDEDAVEATMATAGRTITFSALTVAVSLSGLFVFDVAIFPALAAAGVSVVLVALAAGLTLTPALLGVFGRRISVPSGPVPDDGFFARLAQRVQRRAGLVAVTVSVFLVALGAPFLHANYQNGGADLLPSTFESREFAEERAARFPGQGVAPVVLLARVDAPTLQQHADTLGDLPGVVRVSAAEQREDGWSALEFTPSGATQGDEAQQVVRELRERRPPYPSWVTGDAAVLVDFKAAVVDGLPAALAILGLGTVVLLFLMTGSLLIPVKALVMNTLSMGATFGVLVAVFQDGRGSDLLGFTPTGGLETWVPVVVFAFAFGISMDYEVFLLSRIKEIHDSGVDNDRAVVLGLQRSGRIITSAALVVVIVFLGFAAGKMLGIKELGLALAVAVAVDATLVRCLLVPATMSLLGEWNWWAPAPLRRLHRRFGLHEGAPPEVARQFSDVRR